MRSSNLKERPDYPRVTVTSHRPSIDGYVVEGQAGTAVIVADDPGTVYINGDGWYGAWPIEETDLAEAQEEAKRKEEAEREAVKVAQEQREENMKLRAEEWAISGLEPRSYLLTPDGEMLDPQGEAAFEWVKRYLGATPSESSPSGE